MCLFGEECQWMHDGKLCPEERWPTEILLLSLDCPLEAVTETLSKSVQ